MCIMYKTYCNHKFVNFGPTKLAKQNRKIIQTKYLLKLKYYGYNLKYNTRSEKIFSIFSL